MGFGLLFIPILGGYLFVRLCYWTQFTGSRQGGYHLLFRSAIAGAFLLLFAWLLTLLRPQLADGWLIQIWPAIKPFPYAATLALSLALGPTSAGLVNLFYGKERASFDAMFAKHDAMEQLLYQVVLFDDLTVEVTLVNGKVYAGWILGATGIRDRKYVEVMPVASGYRSKDTHEIHFTTSYADVLDLAVRG